MRILFIFLLLPAIIVSAQQAVLTQHNNLSRTGWNDQETILKVTNVKQGLFGKLFTRVVDDQIYAQPLVMSGVSIPSVGMRNLVFVATVNNSVYAFDADSAHVGTAYWQRNLTPANSRPPLNTDVTGGWCPNGYHDFAGKMGIVGTPVIDPATQTLYVVARSYNNNTNIFEQFLHSLDITTGNERTNSPVKITASVSGSGDGNVGGVVSFDPMRQNQRSGLLLLNGIVYITYASHCDWGPYHGWILGYDKTTLQQKIVYNTTPDGYNGGIWMSGAAPSADEAGNIYVAVGNGSIGKGTNFSDLTNRGESALKLVPSGSTLTISTFFTPKNIQDLEASDLDFGVTKIMLIPETNRAITGCKDGKLYLVDRNNMGGFSSTINNVIQTIDLGTNAHLRSTLAYYKGEQKEFVYTWSENSLLKAFPYNRTTSQFDLNGTVSSGVQGPTGNNGAFLSVSSNGSVDSTAILWTSYASNGDANQATRPGILRAFSASDVTKELWNSLQDPNDDLGNYAKFNCPTVANGKVYLATFSNTLIVYGLTGESVIEQCNSVNLGLSKTAVATTIEGNNAPASYAVDGNLNTRWSSQFSDPQSIYIDLGDTYDLCSVVLHWETALGKDFKIQTSVDAVNWTTLITVTGNTSTENYLPVHGTGRYVRMYGTARGTQYGYSLWEFEVYGDKPASCLSPTALANTGIAQDAAVLHWNGSDAAQFKVQYKTVSAGNWTTVNVATDSLKLTGLACATDYLFQVQAVCDGTHNVSSYSSPSSFSTSSCTEDCPPLPTRWTTLDIGDVGIAGSACYNNGTFELKGSGAGIGDLQDGFRFACKTLVGGGEIQARVLSLDQVNDWNKCGIMFRESLTPGSRYAFVALTAGTGISFLTRTVTDGVGTEAWADGSIMTPYWIKVVKNGTLYTAYSSPDGLNWTKIGEPVDAGFGADAPVYAGLALTSHDNAALIGANVDNYQLSGIVDVELQSFEASLTLTKKVALHWVTTLETNIKSFVIERSLDNIHYTDLDTVAAVSQGKFTQTYNYQDNSPLNVLSYYRLRIIDNEGLTSYSAPVSISIITSLPPVLNHEPPSVFENPVKDGVVHIRQGQDKIRLITLYDVNDRILARISSIESSVTDLPVNTLMNGLYVLEIKTSQAVYREKLLIRN